MGLPVTIVAAAIALGVLGGLIGGALIAVVFPPPLDETHRERRLDEHLLKLARKEHAHDV